MSEVTCAVCLEEILPSERRSQAAPETGCVHTFHWECIRTWFRVKASCPICSTSLLEEGIFEVNPDSGEQTYHRIRPEGVRGSLHAASAAGNAVDVQRLIASGANVNRTTLGGVAPLHMAAHNGHAEVIARLLASAADVNQLAPGGTTALYIAAQGQHADAVARLLAGGAAVNLPVDGGGTALHVAAQNGHTEAVAWLLAGSAEVDAVMEGGITPLFMAAQSGHIEVIVRLLAQGASVNVTAENGATSLHYASLHGHSESVARLLVARSDVNETTRSGGTALHVAAQSGHTEAVAWLLAGRADVHKEMVGGSTALYLASLGGHPEVIAWLLAKQAAYPVVTVANGPLESATLHFAMRFVVLRVMASMLGLRTGLAEFTYFAQHAIFRTLETRQANADSVQLAEIYLQGPDQNQVDLSFATATNPSGDNHGGDHPPSFAIDKSGTRWLDYNKQDLIISLPTPYTAIRYCGILLAEERHERDPVMFELLLSQDAVTWVLVYKNSNPANVPDIRQHSILNLPLAAQFQDFFLEITAVRNGDQVQVSEIQFWDVRSPPAELDLVALGAQAWSWGQGSSPSGEEPGKAVDGDVSTQWLESSIHVSGGLHIRLSNPVSLSSWTWVTSSNFVERDPVQWNFYGLYMESDNINMVPPLCFCRDALLINSKFNFSVTYHIDIRQQHVNIQCIFYLDIQQQHININFACHIIFVQHHLHINFVDHDVIHNDDHVGHHHNDHFNFKFSYSVKCHTCTRQQHINFQCFGYFDIQQQHININLEYDIIIGQQHLHIKFVDHHVIQNHHHIGLDNNHLIINVKFNFSVTYHINIRQQHVNIQCIFYLDIQQQHININFACHIIFVQHHLHINFVDHDVIHNDDHVGHHHNDHFNFKFSYSIKYHINIRQQHIIIPRVCYLDMEQQLNVKVVDDHVNHYDDDCHCYLRRRSRFGSPLEPVGGRPGSKPDRGHHAAVSVVGLGLKRRELVQSRIVRHATKRDPQRGDVDPHQSSTNRAQRKSGRLSPSVCWKVSRGWANGTVHVGGPPGVRSG
ncbi:unnamed protein product [Symbiodinium sp. CCMP2456]|nr:unnamed protein product [Symbiodinium sp. CCMP2456]